MCELKILFDLSDIHATKGSEAMLAAWQHIDKRNISIIQNIDERCFVVKPEYRPLIQQLKMMCCGTCSDTPSMPFEELKIVRDLYSSDIETIAPAIEKTIIEYIHWVEFEKQQHAKNLQAIHNLMLSSIQTVLS